MYLVYNEQTGDFEEKLYKDPPELSFNMANSGNSVFKGDKVHLTWSTKDAEKVTLDGEELSDQVFSQDIICENTGLRDFVLVASNPCGETRRVISVSVIDKPSFDISCSRPKLKRGKNETCELRWNIRFAHSVTLTTPEGETNVDSSGMKILSPTESEVLKFKALAIDNSTTFSEEIKIGVYDESIAKFEADKDYSYPHLPVVLSWKVEHAQSIELDGYGEQPSEGTLIVEPTRTTTYKLLIKDEFGEKTYEKSVQMLPLPFVKSIMAPMPNFINNMSVTIKQPRFKTEVKFPVIDIDWIRTGTPRVKSLTELGLNVELSPPLHSFSIWSSIMKELNLIINNVLKFRK